MKRKDERIALRLSEGELSRVQEIARMNSCSLSQAVRLCLNATTIRTVAVLQIDPLTNSNPGVVRQDMTTGIAL